MKHNYRLVAVDMDGTLLRRDKTVGEKTVQAMNAALEQGTEVIIATGRSRVQSERYMKLFPKLRYSITSSGAVVYDLHDNWRKVVSNEIPPEVALEILKYADEQDCFPIISVEGKTVYTARLAPVAPLYGLGAYVYEINTYGTGVDSVYDWYRAHQQPVESISLYFRDHSFCKGAVDALSHLPLYFALPREPAVEIGMDTANKGYALTKLCELLNISLEDVAAVGDSDNDVPMLEIAGLAISPANAPNAVKARVDCVVADCDHDGVAEALERFVIR